jgi:hypothetical protein
VLRRTFGSKRRGWSNIERGGIDGTYVGEGTDILYTINTYTRIEILTRFTDLTLFPREQGITYEIINFICGFTYSDFQIIFAPANDTQS